MPIPKTRVAAGAEAARTARSSRRRSSPCWEHHRQRSPAPSRPPVASVRRSAAAQQCRERPRGPCGVPRRSVRSLLARPPRGQSSRSHDARAARGARRRPQSGAIRSTRTSITASGASRNRPRRRGGDVLRLDGVEESALPSGHGAHEPRGALGVPEQQARDPPRDGTPPLSGWASRTRCRRLLAGDYRRRAGSRAAQGSRRFGYRRGGRRRDCRPRGLC